MSTSARLSEDDDRFPGARPVRPPLAVVPSVPDTTAPEPNVGRTAMIGYLVGFVASAAIITAVGTIEGLGVGASFGLSAFVGVWDGGGFGFMMGGTIRLAQYLDDPSQRARSARPTPPQIMTQPPNDTPDAHHEPH